MVSIDRVHDRTVLDALERIEPEVFDGQVWRTAIVGRDPLRGSATSGRWSPNGEYEVLYASVDRAGSLAEIGYRLSLEPVWPTRISHQIHRLSAKTDKTLRFASVDDLEPFGVDPRKYASFDYSATQAISAAARFLEFDGLLVPSARHPSTNLVIFMDRGSMGHLEVEHSEDVDWAVWRKSRQS